MSKDYTLNALNGHIHDQIHNLLNPDLSEEELKREVARSEALAVLSEKSIAIANTYIKAGATFGTKTPPKLLDGD